MRRIVLLAAALSLAAAPRHLHGQFAQGGFLMAGVGGGATTLLQTRGFIEMAYLVEAGDLTGPYVGGRSVLGVRWLRNDPQGFESVYDHGPIRDGGGTFYDTGIDVEMGYGVGMVRAYGFVGGHYYQLFQNPATVEAEDGEIDVSSRRRETLAPAWGAGVQLHLTPDGALVAEWYRGGDDEVMRISGTRFGLRWAW